MVFSSYLFLFAFLGVCLSVYYLLPQKARHLFLTLNSYLFYGWANPLFMILMFVSGTIDYIAGLVISGWWSKDRHRHADGDPEFLPKDAPRRRYQKIALGTSIVSNLALLGFFKYFNFAVENYSALMTALGLPGLGVEDAMNVVLPLGISFYTFQSMSYTIDVYRGEARALRSFIDFQCYISMFPQLVAGPIVRFQEVSEQLRSRVHSLDKFARGVAFFAMGMAKKVLVANPCGKIADTVFDAGTATAIDHWYGMFAYAFQIYFDFSAYSDMAIGLGLMMGFVFLKNFDSPYKSRSITEFWRRWHISLSTWLRDYLYIPLGGNRLGEARTYVNLAVVMLLGGLWHGASWNFIIWGGIHGGWLALERALGKDSFHSRLPAPVQVAVTFLIVCFAWVFFRAKDLSSACGYLGGLFGVGERAEAALLGGLLYQPYYLLMFSIAAVIVWAAPQTWDFTRRLGLAKALLIAALFLLSLGLLSAQAYNPFIYFIF